MKKWKMENGKWMTRELGEDFKAVGNEIKES